MRRKIFSIWSVLLVLVVSIAVLVPGCCGPPQCIIEVKATLDGAPWTGAVQYTLTGPGAEASPVTGTSVEDTFRVDCGNWTCAYVSGGPAGASFVNITPASTQSVANGGTITFTLNFVTPQAAGHFNCYRVEQSDSGEAEVVQLEDQFGAVYAALVIARPEYFCNPVEKVHDGNVTPISNQDHHLTLYPCLYHGYDDSQRWVVEVDNQFGEQKLTVFKPVGLAVPTQKEGHDPPEGLDHFLLYEVIEGPDVEEIVFLRDQFVDVPEVLVTAPGLFAIPVQKIDATGMVTEIENPEAHLVFYEIEGWFFETQVQVVNQFGNQTLDVYGPAGLAMPSEKLNVTTPQP